MKPAKKFAAALYLLASTLVLGTYALLIFGDFFPPLQDVRGYLLDLVQLSGFQIAALICVLVILVQLFYVLGLVLFTQPAPRSVTAVDNPELEITLTALEAVARAAADRDPDVMVDTLEARVAGRRHESVRITIDVISLIDTGFEGLGARLQQRVKDACEHMLNLSNVIVHVRFLPSKTTTVNKEGSSE